MFKVLSFMFFVFVFCFTLLSKADDFPIVSFPFDNYLLAYWSFDDCTGTDNSGNGRNATSSGNPTCVNGKVGKAFQFDGTDDEMYAPAVNQNTSITVAAWVNASYIDSNYAHTVVFERKSDGTDYCGSNSAGNYGLQLYQGKFLFNTSTMNSSGTCIYKWITAVTPQLNTWYCLVGTYDKSTKKMKLYVDGQKVAEDSTYENLRTVSDAKIRISKNSSSAPQRWKGILDEIRIYSKALSDSEIQELCSAGGGGGCQANLSILSMTASPGTSNAIQPVNISYGSTSCATQVQFDISYNSSYLNLAGVETGSASSSAGKSCSYNILGSGSARIICAGNNQNTIGSGELVRLKWNISSNAPQGQSTTVGCSNAIGSDSSGNTFNMNCSSGTVTFSSGNCCDLNNDGSVNVGDVQVIVNVAIGKQSCPK